MAGQIKQMIDTLIDQRSEGIKVMEGVVKMKLILKGIDPKNYSTDSPDDPNVISKLRELISEWK